jgi:hypothetical protein
MPIKTIQQHPCGNPGVTPGKMPPRGCCAVELGKAEMRVEIMVTAALGEAELGIR